MPYMIHQPARNLDTKSNSLGEEAIDGGNTRPEAHYLIYLLIILGLIYAYLGLILVFFGMSQLWTAACRNVTTKELNRL